MLSKTAQFALMCMFIIILSACESSTKQSLPIHLRALPVATQTIQSQVRGISQQSNELLQQSEFTRAKAGELDELMTTLPQIATSYRLSSG